MESRIFVTSDLHFFHKRIREYCPDSRGHFTSVEEMNHAIVQNWNNKVSAQDIVYILGDVAFCNAKDATMMMNQLHGNKYLVRGNHDSSLVKSGDFKSKFGWVRDYYELKYNDRWIMMSHYPFLEWNSKHRGSIQLHGHQHSKNPEQLEVRRYDAGLDGSPDFAPYLLDDLIKEIDNRLVQEPMVCHHGRVINEE